VDNDRWRRVEEVFHEALSLTAIPRARLLDTSCRGDPALRAEVDSLLAYEASSGAFIEAPALDVAARLMAADPSCRDRPLSDTTISHFRVLEKLGQGGMGVVYEAIDTRLGRKVALKFLPTHVVSNPQVLQRFEREARAASALNHPNICTIHSVQDHDGERFIEMERLEGQTLRARIAGESMAIDDVVSLALQILDGLEAAHASGIVHRDLKPGNVFCTARGAVKILDFGIATVDSVADDESSDVAGTVAYMSPEQALGQPTDSRTDLFSLGAVLYEMATGRLAFQESSPERTRHAIVTADPIPPRVLNRRVPAALEGIILKALQKERALRYQRASDLRIDLQRLQKRATRQRRQAFAAAVIVVMGLFAGIAFWQSPYFPTQMFSDANVSVRQLTHNADELGVGSGVISADGQFVAFTDRTGIHVRTIDTGETRTVPQSDRLPSIAKWDLASGWIADETQFVVNLVTGDDAADSTILLVGASGPPRKLRDRGQAIAISPDGWWIAFATAGGQYSYRNIWLLSRDGQSERKLFEADHGSSIAALAWSPDGRRVAYVRVNEAGMGGAIETRDLSGQTSTIFRAVEPERLQGVAWLRDGRLLYSLRRQVSNDMPGGTRPCTHWQMRLDNTGQPLGSSTPMASWLPHCVGLSVSANGKRASYLQWGLQDVIRLGDLNHEGTRITASSRLTFTQGRNIPSGWTSDVKSLIFVSDGSGRSALVRQDVDAEKPQPIVEEPGIIGAARLTPEGASVLYLGEPRHSRGSRRLMQVPVTGGTSREILTGTFVDGGARCAVLPATLCAIAELSAGGRQLVFTSIDVLSGRGRELARVNIGGKGEYRWALSPDGARIAVLDVKRPNIDVLSLTGLPPIHVEVKGHSALGYVSWTADGNRLLVPSVDAGGAALLSVDLGGNSHVLWHQPGALDISGIASPDGRRVAIWVRGGSGNLWLAEIF